MFKKRPTTVTVHSGQARIRIACQVTYLNCLLESDNLTEHQRRLLVLALDENLAIRDMLNAGGM